MTAEEDQASRDDLHSVAESLTRIDTSLSRIADCVCGLHLVATHSDPTKEILMGAPAKLAFKKMLKSGTGPAGDKDTVTITVLDQQGNPLPTAATIVPTSSDLTTLTTDQPVGMTYGEHFLKAGSVSVAIVATFADGTTLSLSDSVSITGVPGSLVATHSAPVVGP
jgi:hypothetical protein